MTDLTPEEKKMLMEAIGQGMGEPMKQFLPEMKLISEANKKDYIERLTRIEAKMDALGITEQDIAETMPDPPGTER